MYECLDCGCEFEKPYKWVEDYGETFEVCPYCKSADIDFLEKCECCGELTPLSKAAVEGYYTVYCQSCVADAITAMNEYMKHGTPMTEKQRKTFLDYYENT